MNSTAKKNISKKEHENKFLDIFIELISNLFI
jgi:hypothetical protein